MVWWRYRPRISLGASVISSFSTPQASCGASAPIKSRAVISGSRPEDLLRCEPIQATLRSVFQHPERAIRRFLNIADAFAEAPALDRGGAALAIKGEANPAHADKSPEQGAAIPVREFVALVEHEVAWRDHRHPIDHRLDEIGTRVGGGDGHVVVIDAVRNQWPAVVLATLDQIQLVTAARAVLEFPQPTVRTEGEAIRRGGGRGATFGPAGGG